MKSSIIVTTHMQKRKTDYEQLASLYSEYGIDTLRVNCTRFSNERYIEHVQLFREAFYNVGKDVDIIFDIPYPGDKDRIFFNHSGKHCVNLNEIYLLELEKESNQIDNLYIKDTHVIESASINDILVVGDGEVCFIVKDKGKKYLLLKALNSGSFTLGKSITNTTSRCVKTCSVEKTKNIRFLIEKCKPNGLALSFCETAEQVKIAKEIFNIERIIPKIETLQGAQNIHNILREVSEIMIGRGDLGINEELEWPFIQENIIRTVQNTKKAVYVATGILTSLETGMAIPCRAEMYDLRELKKRGAGIVLSAENANTSEIFKRTMKFINGVRV